LLDPEAVFAHFAMLHFAKAPRGVVLESQFFMEGSTSEAQAKIANRSNAHNKETAVM